MVRSRSVSRHRVTVIDPGNPDAECLDPNQLLEKLLSNISSLDIPLIVVLSDEVNTVNYPLKTFTAKLWPIKNGKVVFGLSKLSFKQLRVSIRFDLEIESEP